MNVKNLKTSPEKRDECIKLIELSFDYIPPYSYSEDFKLLMNKNNDENCFFIEEDNKVICTVFTLPRILQYDESTVPALFIGGISVAKEQREKGLFTSLFKTILLMQPDNALYFLWSDLSSLYEKFEFYEFGLIEEINNDSNQAALPPANKQQFENIKLDYEKMRSQYILPQRSSADWELLWTSQSINKLVGESNKIYLVGKGMDLQNIIHESHPLDKKNETSYKCWNFTPEESSENLSRYMGFIKLGNLPLLSLFIQSISKNKIKIISLQDEQLTIEYDGGEYQMHPKDFLQGLWGPGKIEEWSTIIPQLIIFGFDSV